MGAFTNINAVGNTNCYWLAFLYDATSAVNGTYVNCGDLTPMTVTAKASYSNTLSGVYTVVSGIPSSVKLTSGFLSAGAQVGGYGQQYQAYAQVVTTVAQSSIVPGPSGNYLG